MKILATTPIPTQDLIALRNQLRVLDDQVEKLINYAFVEDPKTEASPQPQVADVSAEPKKEASSEEEILPGIFVKKPSSKPFEMVIE